MKNDLMAKTFRQFFKSIHKITLIFSERQFEEEYQIHCLENYRLKMTVLFCCFFGYLLVCLKLIEVYFQKSTNLNYLAAVQDSSTYLFNFIRALSYLAIEIIVFIINPLKYIRGFVISTAFTFELIYNSYQVNLVLNSKTFYCGCLVISVLFNSLCISLIYSYNWLLGAINFIISCLIIMIFIFISPILYFDQFLYFLSFAFIGIIFTISLRFLELMRRQSFYFMQQAIQEKRNAEKIIEFFPEPILIEQRGQVNFANIKFIQLNEKASFVSSQSGNLILNMNSINDGLIEELTSKIKNKESCKEFKQYISSSVPVKEPTQFIYSNEITHQEIPFEIISTSMKINNQIQNVYVLKDQTYIKKYEKKKSKDKYSRLFIASVTHNFRTPLNMILGNADILKDRAQIPELIEIATNIIQGSEMLNILI